MKRGRTAPRFKIPIPILDHVNFIMFIIDAWQVWLEHQFMGEFDEAFNDEIFQQIHQEILQKRDGQWMVGETPKEEGVEMMNNFFFFEDDRKQNKLRSVDGWGGGKAKGGRGRDIGLLDQPELLHGGGPQMQCERSPVSKTGKSG